MSPQRYAVFAVLCGTLVLNGWVAAGLVSLGSRSIDNGGSRIAVNTPQGTTTVDVVSGPDSGIVDAASPAPREMHLPALVASASTPDPVQNNVEASALPFEAPEIESILAALPDPHEMLTPVAVASASMPDPVQKDVEAAALPFEVPEIESILAALPDPQEMLAPVAIASVSTPDPVQNNVQASARPFEVPEIESILAALPHPHEMLAPVAAASGSTLDPVQSDVEASAPQLDVAEAGSVGSASSDSLEMQPRATPPVRLVSLFRPASLEEDLKPIVRMVETPNECLVAEICIDDYLWSFYERTPKVDTNKVTVRIKTTVRKKGKTRTVTKAFTKYVAADFTWKDPIAAQRAGMSLKDYVIGGMDRHFKLKLYHALRAADDAGLMPGITSAFRDDYRQAIASGNKAASDSSFHGGSRRGGYGHGLAIDLVSVRGETRMQRWASTVELWKWIDAREKELGIGRPYLDRDPPHVAPIDGKEFAAKRGGARAELAASATSRRQPAAGGDPGVMKPETKAGSARVGSI